VQELREIAMRVSRSARVATARDCKDIHPFNSFFTAAAGEKVSFADENY
jgi:hypothetical protein